VLEDHSELRGCAVYCKHCGIRFFTHPRNAGRKDLHCPFGCRECHRRELGKQRSWRHSQKPEAKEKKRLRNMQRSFPADLDEAKLSVGGDLSPSVNASPAIDPSTEVDDAAHIHVAGEVSSGHCCGATSEGRPEVRHKDKDAIPAATLPAVASAEGREPRIASGDTGPEGNPSFPEVVSAELPTAKPCRNDSHREAANIENPEEALRNLEISLDGLVLDGARVVHSPILPYVRMVVSLIVGKRISKRELFAWLLKIVSQRSIDQQTATRYVLPFLDQHPP